MEKSLFIDKTVYTDREKNCSDKADDCYDLLEKLKIPYKRVSHSPIGTIEGLFEVSDTLGVNVAKNLFLCNAQKTDFYLLVMKGETPFKTRLLSPQLNCSRLSFASEEHMQTYINCTAGSASVMGLLFDKAFKVRLIIDEQLKEEEFFGFHPCDNSASIKIKTADLFEKLLPALNHTPTFVNLIER